MASSIDVEKGRKIITDRYKLLLNDTDGYHRSSIDFNEIISTYINDSNIRQKILNLTNRLIETNNSSSSSSDSSSSITDSDRIEVEKARSMETHILHDFISNSCMFQYKDSDYSSSLPGLTMQNYADVHIRQQINEINDRIKIACTRSMQLNHDLHQNNLVKQIDTNKLKIKCIYMQFNKKLEKEKDQFRAERAVPIEVLEANAESEFKLQRSMYNQSRSKANKASDDNMNLFVQEHARINQWASTAMESIYDKYTTSSSSSTSGTAAESLTMKPSFNNSITYTNASNCKRYHDIVNQRLESFCSSYAKALDVDWSSSDVAAMQISIAQCNQWRASVMQEYTDWYNSTIGGIEAIYCQQLNDMYEKLLLASEVKSRLMLYKVLHDNIDPHADLTHSHPLGSRLLYLARVNDRSSEEIESMLLDIIDQQQQQQQQQQEQRLQQH